MPRLPRSDPGGMVFHVLNRAAARALLFAGPGDYQAFEQVLTEAKQRVPMRILAFCLMPTHWHLVLWPWRDRELARFMHWATTTHAKRWRAHHGTVGHGALYQSRYKSIPVQSDRHFLTVCRYVEQNALRAGLVPRAQDWPWSSLWRRVNSCDDALGDQWPVLRPSDWIDRVDAPPSTQEGREIDRLRECVRNDQPFGSNEWQWTTAARLGTESTLRSRGRPRKWVRTPAPTPLPGL